MAQKKIPESDLALDSDYSENDIFGSHPSWPITWGSLVILLILLLFFLAARFIKYPTTISSKIILTTPIPPQSLIARASGKITFLSVSDSDFVKKDAILAIIENPASYQDVLSVSRQLESFKITSFDLFLSDQFSMSLGELQTDYNNFISILNQYSFFVKNEPTLKNIANLKLQVEKNKALVEMQLVQAGRYERRLRLIRSDYDRDTKLFNEKVVPIKQLEEKEITLINTEIDYEVANISSIQTKISLASLQKELISMEIQGEREKSEFEIKILDSFTKLKSSISNWKQKYVIASPMDGLVAFFNIWTNGQFVREGDEVITVLPVNVSQHVIIGRVKMPITNSGRVHHGQIVNIYLDNYPFQEYGIIKGYITQISLISRENTYSIELALPSNLVTTYGKRLSFKQELQGRAEIITEDLSILERIFYELRKIFNKRFEMSK
jgi:multidrug resistance efflux pump